MVGSKVIKSSIGQLMNARFHDAAAQYFTLSTRATEWFSGSVDGSV